MEYKAEYFRLRTELELNVIVMRIEQTSEEKEGFNNDIEYTIRGFIYKQACI